MPRKKFRNSQRHISTSERSFREYLSNQPLPQTTRTELIRLIRGGEDTYLELKLKLSNPERIAREIVALANTAGGTMIFGVTDRLRVQGVANSERVQEDLVKICRNEIYPPLVPLIDVVAFDNGRRIVALEISGNNKRPYRTCDGRFYLRIGSEKREASRAELSDLINESRPLRYENIPVTDFRSEDFDDALLWSFAHAFETGVTANDRYETERLLKKDLLLAVGGEGGFLPTVAAVVLFGKKDRVAEALPQSGLLATRFAGDSEESDVVEKIEMTGSLHTLFESALEFVERYCDLRKHRSAKTSSESEEAVAKRGAYHLYSVKEAISNVLIHRDMALQDIGSTISVFNSALEFSNPRRTSGFVPPASKAIRFGITQRVNPQIASIFMRREYGLNLPQGGLPMILKQSRLFSGRRADLTTSNDRFKLRLHSS